MNKFAILADNHVKSFLSTLSTDYNINIDELTHKWLEFNGNVLTKSEKTCEHKFVRKGGEICGASVKGDGLFCTKHKKKEKKEKDILPNAPQNEKVIPIRLNSKIGKFVHTPSGLVFFSKEEKVVYGKLVKDVVTELSDSDIETCQTFHFKYDKNKYMVTTGELGVKIEEKDELLDAE